MMIPKINEVQKIFIFHCELPEVFKPNRLCEEKRFLKLKAYRRIATRYDKLACCFSNTLVRE